jgi:hypothetical protein
MIGPDPPTRDRRFRRKRTEKARPPEREFVLPPAARAALVRLFGPAAAEVRIVEHSRHWTFRGRRFAATTRPGVIFLRDSGAGFLADPELVLEEYFHVLRQWGTGELTRWRYLRQWLRHGYARNPFEVEAKRFARERRAELV